MIIHDFDATEWEELQNNLAAHFLQRSAWANFRQALGEKVIFAAGEGWSWMAVEERSRLGSRLYCPYGPTASSAGALKAALEELKTFAADKTYIRVEPQGPFSRSDLEKIGLKPAQRNIQPAYTWIKDLNKDQDELFGEMSASNRNLHNTASKKGLTFKSSANPDDVRIFIDLMHEVAQRNKIKIHSDDYYLKMAEVLCPLNALKIYIAEHNNLPVAASLVFDDSQTRYYAHAGNRFEARKLQPGNPLVSRMIFDAKANGQQQFDFYGVAPPDEPDHPWAGFTKFKQSFGGHLVDRHGTWELPIKTLNYNLYRFLRRAVK